MLCREKCPRGTKCKPIGNTVTDDGSDFVCVGYHDAEKEEKAEGDKFRHCFKNDDTDSCYDYDEYDMLSVINVMSEAMLIDTMLKKM